MIFCMSHNGVFLGRQKQAMEDPLDEYMGEKDGKELWLVRDGYDETSDRFHDWWSIPDDSYIEKLKKSTRDWYAEIWGVPYNKKLYDEGALQEE